MKAKGFHLKPLLIMAIQWDGQNIDAVKDFFPGVEKMPYEENVGVPLSIPHKFGSFDGNWKVAKTDWIVRGIDQKYFSIPDKEFKKRYEEATDVHEKKEG